MEVSGPLRAPAPLPLGTTPVPIKQEAEWISGLVWTFTRTVRCTGTRTTDHPACSLVSLTTTHSRPAIVATISTEAVLRIVTNRLAPRSASSSAVYCLRLCACVPLARVVDAQLFCCPLKWCKVRTLRCGHIAERCDERALLCPQDVSWTWWAPCCSSGGPTNAACSHWLLEDLYSTLTNRIIVSIREAVGTILSFLCGDSSGAGW
jgi:hypothetical protein